MQKAASKLGPEPADAPGPRMAVAPTSAVNATFEEIYRAHGKSVTRWALRLLGPTEDFEDVVQDVFLVVKRRLPQFRGDAQITTWLYEITVRVVQEWRKRARWWSWVTGRGQSPSRGRLHFELWAPSEPVPDPHALYEARERTRVLYQLLDQLSESYRTTFILFELEGLSGERIAEITGAHLSTVWTRLSRGRRKFTELMRAWNEACRVAAGEAKDKP